MQDVFIRADGGSTLGLGHLVRCMALAAMLKENFCIHFFCKEIPDKIAVDIRQQNYYLHLYDDDKFFFNYINKKKIVVIDGYYFDESYQIKIKNKGCILVCIDDLHDKEIFADLIINHAPGVNRRDYKAQPYTRFALGPEYALLRPAFLRVADNRKEVKKIESLLICFGGADKDNLTHKAIAAAISIHQLKKIYVVTGAGYLYTNTLLPLIADHVESHHAIDEDTMLALMMRSDAAIVPASGILLEVLAAGCIAFCGYYIDNQKEMYTNCKALNIIKDLGDFSNIHNELPQKIISTVTNAVSVVDGLSGIRLLKLFKTLDEQIKEIA